MNRREVERVFRDWDADQSGQYLKDFTYTEFLAATFDRKACLTEAVCREAFNSLDKNKDGSLDLAELHTGRLLGHIDMDELKDTLEERLPRQRRQNPARVADNRVSDFHCSTSRAGRNGTE